MSRAIGLVRDLIFRSKIDAVARAVGTEVVYASTIDIALARFGESPATAVFVDLSDASLPAADVAARIRAAAPNVRLIGFASHVDLKSLRSARDAGFDQTLSREEFTSRLPELLSSPK